VFRLGILPSLPVAMSVTRYLKYGTLPNLPCSLRSPTLPRAC
jgi:hypothetical protein